MVHARLVVFALELSFARHYHEVVVALVIHRKDRQVVAHFIFERITVMTTAFVPQYRLRCQGLAYVFTIYRGFIKLENAAHRAMVGHGRSLHALML